MKFISLKKAIFPVLFLLLSANIFSQERMSLYTNTDTLARERIINKRPWTVSPFSIKAGAFLAVNNTDIGAGTNRGPYNIIDFEDDLGMNKNTYSVMFNFNARFRKHNRIDFSYFNINRNVTATLDKDIHFRDHDYPVNSEIDAFLNTNVFRLSYGYSFVTNEHWDAGALAGFHVMSFNVGMDLIGNTQQLSYEDDVKFTAPLPDFGLWGTYAFHDHWAVSAEASLFSVKIDEIRGRILNANLAAQYKINKHWEVDLGYNYYDVNVKLTRKHLDADFDWSYSGPYVNVAFKFGHFKL